MFLEKEFSITKNRFFIESFYERKLQVSRLKRWENSLDYIQGIAVNEGSLKGIACIKISQFNEK